MSKQQKLLNHLISKVPEDSSNGIKCDNFQPERNKKVCLIKKCNEFIKNV